LQAAPGECSVHVTGDFNGWDTGATPMSRLKNGDYGVTVDLETGREYRFRYLIDGCRWENDWGADRYDPNPHGEFDSVVVV
jgi:1,4-alpha-glucan branching enzyme